jgi:hypothetical protein
MAIIDADNPALSGNNRQFWEDQLKNSRILLFELDKAILALERQEIERYTLDTGQSTVTVSRQNLPELIKQRGALLKQVEDIKSILESIDNQGRGAFTRVVPAW